MPSKQPPKPPRVLLADDHEATRSGLAKALRGVGFDVEELPDGGRLLVRLAEAYKGEGHPEDIDLVVSDVQMPVINGLGIVRTLRQAHWTTEILIITGFSTPEVIETARTIGATLMLKPIDLDAFLEKAWELVRKKRDAEAATGRGR